MFSSVVSASPVSSLLPGISGVGFRQVLSLSRGRYKRTVSVTRGPDGEMWVKEVRSLCDLCLGGGRKVKKRERREGGIVGVFQGSTLPGLTEGRGRMGVEGLTCHRGFTCHQTESWLVFIWGSQTERERTMSSLPSCLSLFPLSLLCEVLEYKQCRGKACWAFWIGFQRGPRQMVKAVVVLWALGLKISP